MALSAGSRLGPYEILSALGAGGMGEVYRARDTRLKREVAIKVLPDAFSTDPERLARFQREAEVLATLNHPNIAGVYGLEDSGGEVAIVLELVDGRTLAELIVDSGRSGGGRAGMPLDEVLSIGRQIAEAIEAAHDKGVIHRDLKPANVKVTPQGKVKVLDFGLARILQPDVIASRDSSTNVTMPPSMSPTIAASPTVGGVILGTAAYMSPEQARGKTVDRHTDIWAFGCVLFEMLTGRLAFESDTFSDSIAAILKNEPDWKALPADTPPYVRTLLRRCLQKDPQKRLPHIGIARLEIEEGATDAQTRAGEDPAAPEDRASSTRVAWGVAAVALVVAAALSIPAFRYGRSPAAERLQTRFEIPTPSTTEPASFALSPDGQELAYVADAKTGSQLWIRPLDQVAARPLAGTQGASYPFWSPDGKSLGFFAESRLKRVDVVGGAAPRVLAETASGRGGTWSRDGVILFAPGTSNRPLLRVAQTGGPIANATTLAPGQGSHRWPQFLPDGRHFLFLAALGQPDTRGVFLGTLDGGEPRRVLSDETAAVFAPPGALFVVRQGVLVRLGFDTATGEVSGKPTVLANDVGEFFVNRGSFSVSMNGVLAYRGGGAPPRQLVWMDRAGHIVGVLNEPDSNAIASPELSSDGRRVAVQRIVQGNVDIWLIDVARGVSTRFTFDSREDTYPLFSPDGSRVIFVSTRRGTGTLYEKAVSGAAEEQPLSPPSERTTPLSWSSDGRYLLYAATGEKTGSDLWALPLAGGTAIPVATTQFEEVAGQFSSDGHWVAYVSNESGRMEVYVRPFPEAGGATRVSTDGGTHPRWRPDGKELFYVAPDGRLMAAPMATPKTGHTLDPGAPVALFTPRFAIGASITQTKPQYAVGRDGRFLINSALEQATPPITLVLNWDAPAVQ